MPSKGEPSFRLQEWRLAGVVALALTWLFWWPLWLGGGLIGGDLYSYALPQKVFFSDQLQAGVLPLWHTWTGQGYPLLAESQTGVLYPLHWVTYGLLDVQTATNVVQIVHYLAAFLATWWMSRWLGLGSRGATLSAVVYVFGWFPVRASLDWAILGGLYLPLAIGCAEAYRQTQRRRYAIGLSLAIGLQLLGGHFQIAFYTWLLLVAYIIARAFLGAGACRPGLLSSERREDRGDTPRLLTAIAIAFALGVMLAAVQLSATWELKTRSQRAVVGGEHLPFYGHLPPLYLTQLVAPWLWYDPAIDLDAAINRLPGSVPAATNRAEAHLYFGLIPLALIVGGLVIESRRRRLDRWTIFWCLILLAAVAYATGWPLMVLQYVPGFNFFRGPARTGIVATLAAGLLAGRYFEQFGGWCRGRRLPTLPMLLFWVTVADLWWTPQAVTYASVMAEPPIRRRDVSVVRQLLLKEEQPPRLFAPGQNLPNLLGVSALPVYLGLGPQEYFDPQYAAPKVDPDDHHTYSAERVAWLRAGGVTHILSFEPLEPRGWPVEHVWTGFDPLLNPAWDRFREPVHLYRLNEARGRVFWADADATGSATVTAYGPHRVQVRAESVNGGRLVLTELAYPGWDVAVDGEPVASPPTEGMFRAVDLTAGTHEIVWTYRPRSVFWGAVLSAIAGMALVVLSRARFL
ncbi:MAG: YfhO family protein [Planctomycetaceae bacterium]|nr:YfhO family protein [Planctomycetaceae bacterium]